MSEPNLTGNVSSEPGPTKIVATEFPSPESEHAHQQVKQVQIDPPEKLSAEEQMALYEKSLKEDDWGHQPC